MIPKWQKFLLSVLGILLAGIVAGFAVVLHQTKRELDTFERKVDSYELRLAQLKEDVRIKEIYLDKIRNDPEFLERVVRERLGYSEPGDLLYRFPQDQ